MLEAEEIIGTSLITFDGSDEYLEIPSLLWE